MLKPSLPLHNSGYVTAFRTDRWLKTGRNISSTRHFQMYIYLYRVTAIGIILFRFDWKSIENKAKLIIGRGTTRSGVILLLGIWKHQWRKRGRIVYFNKVLQSVHNISKRIQYYSSRNFLLNTIHVMQIK